jgi:putative MFS transporter
MTGKDMPHHAAGRLREDNMSVVEMAAGTAPAAARGGPDEISCRLESLPASSYLWRLVILLSLGGW